MSILYPDSGQGFYSIEFGSKQLDVSWSVAHRIEEISYNTDQLPNLPLPITLQDQNFSSTGAVLQANWQLVNPALTGSGSAFLSLTPVAANWAAVSGTFTTTGIATFTFLPASGTWVVNNTTLAVSGAAHRTIGPVNSGWSPSSFPHRATRQRGSTVGETFVTGTSGEFNLNAYGADPAHGFYYRESENDPWIFIDPDDIDENGNFHLPVNSAFFRYVYHVDLVQRGQLPDGPWTRLPHWMSPQQDLSTTLDKVLTPLTFQKELVFNESKRNQLAHWVQLASVGEDRVGWVAAVQGIPTQNILVNWRSDEGTEGSARAALSPFDFTTATDPVWWIDTNSKRILLRNLMVVETILINPTPVYTIFGEDSGLVPDWGIYWRTSVDLPWNWLDPESQYVSGNTFVLPITGTVAVRYASQAILDGLDGELDISWLGGATKTFELTFITPSNIFDAYGDLIGLKRITGEDNLTYKNRLKIALLAPANTTIPGVIRGVAAQIGLISSTPWDGVSTLVLDASGTSGITQVTVVEFPQIREVTEQLTPDNQNPSKFYASYSGWRGGAIIFEDGRTVPVSSVSGNVVTLGRPASGFVQATYSFSQYSTSGDTSGFIRAILPGYGVTSGSYTLVITRNVKAYTPDLPSVQLDRLLLANGLPNRLFLDIVREVNEGNPTVFGRGRWAWATWFEQTDELPPMARLPVSLDVTSMVECADQSFFGVLYVSPPINLTVTSSGTTSLILNWTDTSDNEDGFLIERSPDGIGSWVQIAQVAANVTTYTDTGLTPGTVYFYRVRAFSNL